MMKPLVYAAAVLFVGGALATQSASAADEKKPAFPAKAASMKIGGQLQLRYTDTQEGTGTFGWKRARLTLDGDVNEFLYYQMKFQGDDLPVDAAKMTGKWGFNSTYLGFHLPSSMGDIEAGRFDVDAAPRSGSSRLLFAERAQHTEFNKAGGQIGVVYKNAFLDDRVAFSIGAYNGNGDTNSDVGNENKSLMTAGRLTLTPYSGYDCDTESDLKQSDFSWGILLGYWKDQRGSDTNVKVKATTMTVVTDVTQNATTGVITKKTKTITAYTQVADPNRADLMTTGYALSMKWKGLSAQIDGTNRKSDAKSLAPAKYDFTAKGMSVQAAYAIPFGNKMAIEPAFRFETYKDDYLSTTAGGLSPDANFQWTTVGFNWYLANFTSSIQCDYIMKKEKGDVPSTKNDTLMIQANLYF